VSHGAGCPVRFDPTDPAQAADPAPVLARLRDECPVHHEERFDPWVVTRYADVDRVLRDPETFSSQGAVTSSARPLPGAVRAVLEQGAWPLTLLTESDPPIHRPLRSLVQSAFTPRRVAALEPVVRARAHALIDGFAADGAAEIIAAFAWPLPIGVIGEMLGVEPERAGDLHLWSRDLLLLLQGAGDVRELVRRAESVLAMQRHFAAALERRRAEPGDDLMGALVAGWDPDRLTFDELVGLPVNLVVAGHLTVTRAIGTAVALLDADGRLGPGLAGDGVAAVVEEALRLEAPAQGLFRRVTRDTTLGGVDLPAGARVMVHFGAANRDDRVFERPDALDPDRGGLSRHMAFGKGAHFCLGAPLARMELRVALGALGERLPGLRVDPARPARHDPIFFARGFEELHVAWDGASARV
jgi:cytochrome P450